MFTTLSLAPTSLPPCSTSVPSSYSYSHRPSLNGSGELQSLSTTAQNPHSKFQRMKASSWAESMRTHVELERFDAAVSTYIAMTTAGVLPDNFSFPAVIKSICCMCDFSLGTQVHAAVVKLGYHESSVTVVNTLLTMYAKCGRRLDDVVQVFDKMVERDQVSWNSYIAALCHFEEWVLALEAFRAMQVDHDWGANSFALVSACVACSQLNTKDGVRLGKELHGYELKDRNCFDNSFIVNALISMYAKLGRVQDGFNLFKMFEMKNLVSWNTVISSFVQNDQLMVALNLFQEMITEGVKPDVMTLSSILPACAHLEMLRIGKEIHCYALRNDLFENSFVSGALVDMYCNCRDTQSGSRVFDGISRTTIEHWNAMISGYARNELDENALRLFVKMELETGLIPNPTTLASVLPACARSEFFLHKECIHGYIIKRGFADDRYVQNAILDMYSRVGKPDVSRRIFENMNDKDIVSWNSMITGYANNNRLDDALRLVSEMWRGRTANAREKIECRSWKPNTITLMAVLPGCGTLSALAEGRELHACAIRQDLSKEITVASALVDMYAKCGCLKQARTLFNRMNKRNIITWNVLIMAYAMHGLGAEAINLFKEMQRNDGIKANAITFIALFAACSHSGLVDEGLEIYNDMKEKHNIDPTPDHYACVVDFLGRAGRLDEALGIIQSMPPGLQQSGAWSCLLAACRLHGNVELGETAASNLFTLEPHVASHYVLMSNIYSYAGEWDKAIELRRKMKEVGVRKEPGCSWIETRNEVHKFIAGDESHPQNSQLNELLEELQKKLKREGYVADTSCVLHNIGKEEKEYMLCGHSERLAIAFGMLNSSPGSTIRIAKNLRICKDCHVAIKYISKIEGREIVVRDVRRFHHFKDGECSCKDYW